ncbi:MAG: hypothetical protein K6E15_10525 [Prevotella sp.]|nr:hypothetical protein [Prevotella sp.]
MRNNYKKLKEQNEALRQKNDTLQFDNNFLRTSRDNMTSMFNIASKERDNAILASKYITHLLLLMDALDKILHEDATLGFVVKKAIFDFKAKLNEGLLDIKTDGENTWFDGDYDDI